MIIYKTDKEIDKIKKSCVLAAKTLKMIEKYIETGISTLELNNICHNYIVKNSAIPAPLNYKGFPKSICTSINDVVCHGIPNEKDILKDGDIINIDITTILNGYHGDCSKTFFVGNVADIAKKITKCARDCLYKAIDSVNIKSKVGDIGYVIQNHAKKNNFSVVKEFVGHGIGKSFHEEPAIFHYGKKGTGLQFKKGMTFTIEPMINQRNWKTRILKDGWTAITIDGGLSAQFEHTIAIRNNGQVEILTIAEN